MKIITYWIKIACWHIGRIEQVYLKKKKNAAYVLQIWLNSWL